MAFGKGHVLVQMEHLYLAPGNVKADEGVQGLKLGGSGGQHQTGMSLAADGLI